MSKVITFVYDGGSNPGQRRTLLLDSEYAGVVEGTDLQKNDFRNFSTNKIRDRQEYETVVVTADNNMQSDIRKLLLNKGYTVYVAGDRVVGAKLIAAKITGWLRVQKGSQCLDIKTSLNGTVLTTVNGIGVNSNSSVDDIIKALQGLK